MSCHLLDDLDECEKEHEEQDEEVKEIQADPKSSLDFKVHRHCVEDEQREIGKHKEEVA
jgi:hypothetical protein